ncbi:MAG: DegV family protein [Oscillospiraceae bacterium]|nr:DegV family protein [Oscillospiraceae bacterium]
MSYVLLTDSGADLPYRYYEEHSIEFLRIRVTINGQTREDDAGKSLDYADFYRMMRGGMMPTTSMINPEDYTRVFTPHLEAGRDILYIAFSSALSGSCGSARMAAQELSARYPDRRIEVFDSLCASLGQGLLVDYVRRMRDDGASLDEILTWVRDAAPRTSHFVTVSDLMHLHRGGRVSRTSAMVGTLIGIKPMIYLNPEGKLIVCGRKRGRRAALEELLRYMEQYVDSEEFDTIAVSHSDCEQDAKQVADMVCRRFKVGQVIINYIGSVIGAHTGPGTVALFFVGKLRMA